MGKVHFAPTSIDLHAVRMDVVGGAPVVVYSRAPELTGDLYADDGSHGMVTVPLDADERAFLTAIIESASKRALALVTEATR